MIPEGMIPHINQSGRHLAWTVRGQILHVLKGQRISHGYGGDWALLKSVH